jgi:thiamine biosynthesis lipoprotein ApbE
VTIIAAQTAQADAIATAASVLGKQAALTWVEQMPGVEALLVGGGPDAEQLYRSSGFRRFEVEGS